MSKKSYDQIAEGLKEVLAAASVEREKHANEKHEYEQWALGSSEDHRLIKSAKSARDGNVSEAAIPDDVWVTADDEVGERNQWRVFTRYDIAKIILAEREANAKIAEDIEVEEGNFLHHTSKAIRRR